jgi:hypothetical protein
MFSIASIYSSIFPLYIKVKGIVGMISYSTTPKFLIFLITGLSLSSPVYRQFNAAKKKRNNKTDW